MKLRRERVVQRVAGGAHGADGIAYAFGVERLPEAPDMDVHRAGLDIDVGAPHRVQQLLAAEHAAGMLDQMVQQFELGGTEMDVAAGPAHRDRKSTRLNSS